MTTPHQPRPISRIAFVVPGSEPGRSGVGDYTALLAAKLNSMGIVTFQVALNDSFIQQPIIEEGSLRLPALARPEQNYSEALLQLRNFSPDWISVQFVAFGYDFTGLPKKFPHFYREMQSIAPVQMMYHELWCGSPHFSLRALKHRWLGRRQQDLISSFHKPPGPNLVHTQSVVYLHLLRKLGVLATLLPLFGSIPIRSSPLAKSELLGMHIPPERLQDSFIACCFGTIHPEWDGQYFLLEMNRALQQSGKTGIVVFAGSIGAFGKKLLESATSLELTHLCLVHFGRAPAEKISALFTHSHLGFTSYPPDLIEKSGGAVAMFEHGLPVVATRSPLYGSRFMDEVRKSCPLLMTELPDLSRKIARGQLQQDAVANITLQFLNDLIAAPPL